MSAQISLSSATAAAPVNASNPALPLASDASDAKLLPPPSSTIPIEVVSVSGKPSLPVATLNIPVNVNAMSGPAAEQQPSGPAVARAHPVVGQANSPEKVVDGEEGEVDYVQFVEDDEEEAVWGEMAEAFSASVGGVPVAGVGSQNELTLTSWVTESKSEGAVRWRLRWDPKGHLATLQRASQAHQRAEVERYVAYDLDPTDVYRDLFSMFATISGGRRNPGPSPAAKAAQRHWDLVPTDIRPVLEASLPPTTRQSRSRIQPSPLNPTILSPASIPSIPQIPLPSIAQIPGPSISQIQVAGAIQLQAPATAAGSIKSLAVTLS
jgi:hypothetical protein